MCISSASFNPDFSELSIVTSTGFYILSTTELNTRRVFSMSKIMKSLMFTYLYQGDEPDLVQYNEEFIVVVYKRSPTSLSIFNRENPKLAYSSKYSAPIMSVRIFKKLLVVVLTNLICIYKMNESKRPRKITFIASDPRSAVAFSVYRDKCILACPHSMIIGSVVIYDVKASKRIRTFTAHGGKLAVLALNEKGTLLATASETGSIIRVFSCLGGGRLMEFRSHSSHIQSINFSIEDEFLVCAGKTDTIHIFKLSVEATLATPVRRTTGSSFSYLLSYLSRISTSAWKPKRHFALAKLPFPPTETEIEVTRKVAALISESGDCSLLVVCQNGCIIKFNFDNEKGGFATLSFIKQLDEIEVARMVHTPSGILEWIPE
ncbi:hypothetical protein Aperf_G00000083050 [Anoplocephala perfoliata]